MTLHVYLAARFSRRDELNRYRTDLESIGLTVTSRWLDGSHDGDGMDDQGIPDADRARFAAEDLEDIDAAEVFIAFVDQPSTRGGLWVELGYAIGKDKPVIVVGASPNIFTALPWIILFASWPEALDLMKRSAA